MTNLKRVRHSGRTIPNQRDWRGSWNLHSSGATAVSLWVLELERGCNFVSLFEQLLTFTVGRWVIAFHELPILSHSFHFVQAVFRPLWEGLESGLHTVGMYEGTAC